MEASNQLVQKWDTETFKDRLMLAAIGFGGLLTVVWCATIAGVAVWLIG